MNDSHLFFFLLATWMLKSKNSMNKWTGTAFQLGQWALPMSGERASLFLQYPVLLNIKEKTAKYLFRICPEKKTFNTVDFIESRKTDFAKRWHYWSQNSGVLLRVLRYLFSIKLPAFKCFLQKVELYLEPCKAFVMEPFCENSLLFLAVSCFYKNLLS